MIEQGTHSKETLRQKAKSAILHLSEHEGMFVSERVNWPGSNPDSKQYAIAFMLTKAQRYGEDDLARGKVIHFSPLTYSSRELCMQDLQKMIEEIKSDIKKGGQVGQS